MAIIEIKPHRWGWRVFESPDVEPVFLEKRQAIDYAETRACFRSGEIRILGATGKLERTIPFNEADRRLGKNDPFFLPAGAEAFRRDIPAAVVRFFDTGHFALETHAAEIAAAIRDFLARHI